MLKKIYKYHLFYYADERTRDALQKRENEIGHKKNRETECRKKLDGKDKIKLNLK
jgi:hypothetical protein